jgi:recombinational DNA repair protein (RecF pathway)
MKRKIGKKKAQQLFRILNSLELCVVDGHSLESKDDVVDWVQEDASRLRALLTKLGLDPPNLPQCKLCKGEKSQDEHMTNHDGGLVCEECWDDRLTTTV